jgi:hypothetical protein
VRDGTRAARTALERECAVIAATTDGGRNNTLHRSVCKLARFVAWGDLPRDVAEQAIQEAGESTGMPPAECRHPQRHGLGHHPHHTTAGSLMTGPHSPVIFFAVLQEGRWPPGPAWLVPPVEPMTWGVVPPGPRGAVGDADERSDYRPAWCNARPLAGGRSA